MARSGPAAYAGPRGDEVNAQCGARVFRRTVAADLLFWETRPIASLSRGHGLRVPAGTGYQVRTGSPLKQPMT